MTAWPARGDVWWPHTDPPGPWIHQGACNGSNPELWFPNRGDTHTTRTATAICQTCPVRQDCLEYAITQRIRHGIWGGLPEQARRRLYTRRPGPAHGTRSRYTAGCRCPDCQQANRDYQRPPTRIAL